VSYSKQCKQCGNLFTARKPNAQTCSGLCRTRWYRTTLAVAKKLLRRKRRRSRKTPAQ
jgi:collagenase-like PrtC family protease